MAMTARQRVRSLLVALVVIVGVFGAAAPPTAAQGPFAHGAVVALQGTPHLWIADAQGVLHWGGDTRGLAGRHVRWSDRTVVSLARLRTLPVGDPWLSAGLLKDGDPIYLVKWETTWARPRLLHIQSIADVELFGINGGNYGTFVLDRATWEARYGLAVAGLERGVLPAVTPPSNAGLTAVVTWAGGLYVRTAPRADGPIAYVAAHGQRLRLTGQTRVVAGVTWWQVSDGYWVQGQYLRFDDGAPPPSSSPTTPPPAPPLPNHPDAALVRDTAIARGASADQAVQIAINVIGRGAVHAFLDGTDAGVVYGRYACQWRSPQCPRAPEQPPSPKSPREQAAALVDPALMPVLDLYKAVLDAAGLNGDGHTFSLIVQRNITVTFGSIQVEAVAAYSPGTSKRSPRLVVNNLFRYEPPWALAPTMAHELWHALSDAHGRLVGATHAACVAEEVNAERVAAWTWAQVRPGPPRTPLEQQAETTYRLWIAGELEESVRARYWDRCAA